MLTKDQSASTRNRSDHILQCLQLDCLHLCPQRRNLLLDALLRRPHLQLLGRRLVADPTLLQIQVQAHPGLCPRDFLPQPLAQLLDLRDQALVVGVGQTKVVLLQHLQLGLQGCEIDLVGVHRLCIFFKPKSGEWLEFRQRGF